MFIKVKVFPGDKRNEITKKADDAFIIHTKAKAEKGEATAAVANALSTYLKIPIGKLKLIKGAKSRSKIFEIRK